MRRILGTSGTIGTDVMFVSSETQKERRKKYEAKNNTQGNTDRNISQICWVIKLQIQQSTETSKRINPKKSTPWHLIIKILQDKDNKTI